MALNSRFLLSCMLSVALLTFHAADLSGTTLDGEAEAAAAYDIGAEESGGGRGRSRRMAAPEAAATNSSASATNSSVEQAGHATTSPAPTTPTAKPSPTDAEAQDAESLVYRRNFGKAALIFAICSCCLVISVISVADKWLAAKKKAEDDNKVERADDAIASEKAEETA
eukprot:CAMPEP_0176115800 /NCGR_PEP_ID=MMETSP0120_2-20121206/58153_1 /TAXON_ID=160619 /ORGANISM="Kryptoperidinium foliaceum, Strain CCMP 1326" /LENGTH=168 /DNA_ID=CAMNT_0017450039 /DNA_START=78 /DNA_END=580 /DNA_ORIENTATION=+